MVIGKAAHAGENDKGTNAIEKAALLISNLAEIEFSDHPRLGRSSLVVQGINSSCGAFSVPDRCQISLSLLTSPGFRGLDFVLLVRQLAEKLQIEITIQPHERATPYGDAYEVDLSTPFLKVLQEQVFIPLGVSPIYTASVADENVFAERLKIPVRSIGVIGGGDHTKDEWASLSSVSTLVDTFTQAIQAWHQRQL